MKKGFVLLAALAISVGAFASEGWMTNFEKAKEKAKAEKKHILIDFSGSDWCGWCIKLDKEVFSQAAFKEYAKGNLVLVMADFPRDKSKVAEEVQKQNDQMAKDFGVRGFPTVFILSPDGKTVAKTGYQAGGAEAYVKHLKDLISKGQ
ncbi:MAG: thioredoxin family protein [Pontiellaceae bacterium]|nr:thioredoxin family protein [Pontiellaceae bacterium]MBN2785764.1 thioredoxin family protein [Pontiellaceae bacterium]